MRAARTSALILSRLFFILPVCLFALTACSALFRDTEETASNVIYTASGSSDPVSELFPGYRTAGRTKAALDLLALRTPHSSSHRNGAFRTQMNAPGCSRSETS